MRDFSRWIAPKVDLWPPIHEHTRAHTHTHMITHRGRERSRIETREERRIRQAEKFGVRDEGWPEKGRAGLRQEREAQRDVRARDTEGEKDGWRSTGTGIRQHSQGSEGGTVLCRTPGPCQCTAVSERLSQHLFFFRT